MTVYKYNASGNDFVIFHTFLKKSNKQKENKYFSQLAIELCDRHNGIGADGLIVLIPHETYDFEWLFYNNDGSFASMCGNGSRACAHYAYVNGLADNKMSFLTGAGKISCSIDGDIVETELTQPVELKESFLQNGFEWWLVDTGVPHLVTVVDDLNLFDLKISAIMRKEYNANVNFAKIEDGKIYVRTYERGVEHETLACGTGMAACFLRANNLGYVADSAKVYPKSNEELTLTRKKSNLLFKGKVKQVFTTQI